MKPLVERFIRYVKISTQADPASQSVPSTTGQHELAQLLGQELKDLGLSNVVVNQQAYVTARLPGNNPHAPAIGFLAHIDTALEVTDRNVNPRVVTNYSGEDIVLDKAGTTVLSPQVFPSLLEDVGNDLIVTDGTTLLGADDKAGIAEIMTALAHLKDHPEIRRGDLCVCFCPDEEIGHGASLLDLKTFGADFAYTVDGTGTGTFSYETFNAAKATITIQGRSVHPGSAKNKMMNAALLAVEMASTLPAAETPRHTEGYEGFFHLCSISGGVEDAQLEYIIRDHDSERFAQRKSMMECLVRQLNERHGATVATLELADQYYNMAQVVQKEPHIVETALQAMKDCGVEPQVHPTRGGTDGSQLSLRGLPTPNIFTGGYNAHGKYEYASVQAMEKAVQVILRIVELYGQKS